MLFRENKKTGEKLSILGLGCMRFPKKGGKIDQEYAEEIMRRAIDSGVNYFDTAYIYSGSEVCVGEFLSKGYRDKVKIATKLPHYMIKTSGDMDKFFDEQKRRLQTDHVEYYLIHMLNDAATWKRLEELGIREEFLLGNVGRFDTQKNHKFILEVHKEILKCKYVIPFNY